MNADFLAAAAEQRTQVLSFATREVAFRTIAMRIGFWIARARRGGIIRVHLYSYTNNNGGQIQTSRYIHEGYRAAVAELIAAEKLNASVTLDGNDMLITVFGDVIPPGN